MERLLSSETRPVALEVLDTQAAKETALDARCELPIAHPVLCVGFEGGEGETAWQVDQLKQECSPHHPSEVAVVDGDQADVLWQTLTEFQTASDQPLTFQANMRPSRTMEFLERAAEFGVAVQAHAGNGIVIGHLPDDMVSVDRAEEVVTSLRQMAFRQGGNLVIFHCDDEWKERLPVFGDSTGSWPLMQKLKQQLDPHNLLNPGRFIDQALAQASATTA